MDNLRAAMRWTPPTSPLWLSAYGFSARWSARRSIGRGRGSWRGRPPGTGRVDALDATRRAVVFRLSAYHAFYLGQFDHAMALRGRAIAESDTSAPALLAAVCAVGYAAFFGGDPAPGLAALTEGRARLQAIGVRDWIASQLSMFVSYIACTTGDVLRGPLIRSRMGVRQLCGRGSPVIAGG